MTDCKTISELLGASRSRSVPLGASQNFSELSHVLSPVLIHLATDVLTMDKAPRGVQPSRAKRGSAARSAAGRRRRPPPPLAERSEAVAPEPREGRQGKLEATELEANKHGANQHLREAGKRALHVQDFEIVGSCVATARA